jgi:hypothetical protein
LTGDIKALHCYGNAPNRDIYYLRVYQALTLETRMCRVGGVPLITAALSYRPTIAKHGRLTTIMATMTPASVFVLHAKHCVSILPHCARSPVTDRQKSR